MKAEEFQDLLHRRIELTKSVLSVKASEYASAADRFHNFKKAAAFTGETPAQVCIGFMMKHLVSVLDLVEATNPSPEVIDEKIGDSINYLILLEGILKENQTKAE